MTSEYVLMALKAVKKSHDNAAQADLMKYRDARIFNFNDTNEWTEIFTSTETLTGSKELAESETPPVCTLDEGYQVSVSPIRFGGAIVVTETEMERMKDNTTMIDTAIARKRDQLLKNNRDAFLQRIFSFLNEAFNPSATHLSPDGVELCGVHSWSNGNTFDNSATMELCETAIDTMEEYAGAFTDSAGTPMPLNFQTIVVKKGSAAAREAKRLFLMQGMVPTTVGDINIYQGEYTVVETPYITTANKKYWFAIASNVENPLYVGVHKYPSMNSPLPQNNESIQSNCTGFYKTGIVNLPIGIYGSDGTVAAV